MSIQTEMKCFLIYSRWFFCIFLRWTCIGMGGLDIYKTELNDFGKYDNVINLKYPINSSTDDFGYITQKDTETGFFSSNEKIG